LQNKLVNVCGDIDAKYMEETGVIKAIIGGDEIHGELKHGKNYWFRPVCRLIFSANKLPPVADKTPGWYNRWKYVKFPNMFPTNPMYKIEYGQLFTKELSGILNWAIEGLIRIKKNNNWTYSEDMHKSEIEYRSENDNVAAFLDDFVDGIQYSGNINDTISTSVLHKCYIDWLDENLSGMKHVSLKEFSARVQTYGYIKTFRQFDGKGRNVFVGMKVKDKHKDMFDNYNKVF
jgi:putative DNA primase/helicase